MKYGIQHGTGNVVMGRDEKPAKTGALKSGTELLSRTGRKLRANGRKGGAKKLWGTKGAKAWARKMLGKTRGK